MRLKDQCGQRWGEHVSIPPFLHHHLPHHESLLVGLQVLRLSLDFQYPLQPRCNDQILVGDLVAAHESLLRSFVYDPCLQTDSWRQIYTVAVPVVLHFSRHINKGLKPDSPGRKLHSDTSLAMSICSINIRSYLASDHESGYEMMGTCVSVKNSWISWQISGRKEAVSR